MDEQEEKLQRIKVELLEELVKLNRILVEQGVQLMSQIDDQNAAIATLNTNVAAIQADVAALVANPPTGPDLTANTAAITTAAANIASATAALKGAFPTLP